MALLLGAIADDFTGATDLANTLVRGGMRTVQVLGVPSADFDPGEADAVVVALKSRTEPATRAVEASLAALHWLRERGVEQVFFKYCSTFDSTDAGNIGPVADALLDALEAGVAIACPAFPTNGRTVYKGHLFVGDELLSDSPMKDHPLTPMRDSNLVKVLGRQTDRPVGLVALDTVRLGPAAIRRSIQAGDERGIRHLVVDAVEDDDLRSIGLAADGLALLTGGSGLALGLPENFRRRGALDGAATIPSMPGSGRRAVLAGSCSVATRAQVAGVAGSWPTFLLDPLALANDPSAVCDGVLAWFAEQDPREPALVYSSADPSVVALVQEQLGRERAGQVVEDAMAGIARGMLEAGVDQFVIAGGETSGAVISALEVRALRIGPEIDPGVPWCEALCSPPLAVALKSGNFGSESFFARAFAMLDRENDRS